MTLSTFAGVIFSLLACCLSESFDKEEAQKFASLSSVAYCENMEPVYNWTCASCQDSKTPLVPGKIRVVDGGLEKSARALIGKLQDQDGCVVSFRGSDNIPNWLRNLEFWSTVPTTFEDCDGCYVHSGFYEVWKALKKEVIKALGEVGCGTTAGKDNDLYITGHSMGAAVTHLAMFQLANAGWNVAKTYSFESPRVGNKAFSDAFTERFTRKIPVFRITHSQDPVVHLPANAWGFTHVQTEVYFDASGAYKVCTEVEDPSCSDQYGNVPDMLLYHASDHCGSPLLPNKDFCNPVGCAASSVTSNSAAFVVV